MKDIVISAMEESVKDLDFEFNPKPDRRNYIQRPVAIPRRDNGQRRFIMRNRRGI